MGIDTQKVFSVSLKTRTLTTDYSDSIVISSAICKIQKETKESSQPSENEQTNTSTNEKEPGTGNETLIDTETPINTKMKQLILDFEIPVGKSSSLLAMINYLQRNFKNVKINIEAENGELDRQDS